MVERKKHKKDKKEKKSPTGGGEPEQESEEEPSLDPDLDLGSSLLVFWEEVSKVTKGVSPFEIMKDETKMKEIHGIIESYGPKLYLLYRKDRANDLKGSLKKIFKLIGQFCLELMQNLHTAVSHGKVQQKLQQKLALISSMMMKASDGKLRIDEFEKFKIMMGSKLKQIPRTVGGRVSKMISPTNKRRGGGRRKNRYKTRKKRKISKKYKTRKKRKISKKYKTRKKRKASRTKRR